MNLLVTRARRACTHYLRSASWLIVAIAAILMLASARVSADQKSASSFVIRNARIFDGEKIITGATVVVGDGKIAAVGSNIATPSDAVIIDATGDTLMPGLIDSHVHVWTRDVLERSLAFGVTTVLDMFMRVGDARYFRKEEAVSASDIADFRSAGTCVTSPGGHGVEEGFPIPTIRNPEDAQAFVDARIAEGSDYIKIMYDFGENFTTLSRATMAAVVKAAHQRGKLVVVHIDSYQGALDAINAGADGLAHTPHDRPPAKDFGAFVKAHHAFVETTLAIPRFLFGTGGGGETIVDDPMLAPYLLTSDAGNLKGITPIKPEVHGMLLHHLEQLKNPTPFEVRERESLKGIAPDQYEAFSNAEETLRLLDRAGVPILVGTDAANAATAGALMHAELGTVVKAGLSPSEALADATSVPARIFSLPRSWQNRARSARGPAPGSRRSDCRHRRDQGHRRNLEAGRQV